MRQEVLRLTGSWSEGDQRCGHARSERFSEYAAASITPEC